MNPTSLVLNNYNNSVCVNWCKSELLRYDNNIKIVNMLLPTLALCFLMVGFIIGDWKTENKFLIRLPWYLIFLSVLLQFIFIWINT